MDYIKPDGSFERMLSRMNDALLSEFNVDRPSEAVRMTGQIIGLPRSGTTILYQLLARTGLVGYPSNVMAFFWDAPHVGARLQERLAQNRPTLSMNSLAGRTAEPLDPHEFGLFWRNALGHSKNSMIADGQRRDSAELRSILDLVNDSFSAPTVFKNFLAPVHLDFLSNEVGRQRFFLVRRDPLEVAASIFRMRRRLNIEVPEWFGPSPADARSEYSSVYEMVAHQVISLRSSIEGPAVMRNSDTTLIELPNLVREPREIVLQIIGKLAPEIDLSAVSATVPRCLEQSESYSGVDVVDLSKLERELSANE